MPDSSARPWRGAGLLAVVGGTPLAPASADDLHPRATAGLSVYSESMDTSVVSASATAGARVPGDVEVDASWSADVISSASVDVITAATNAIDDLRNQVGLTASREDVAPDLDLDAGYAYSFERDSYSHIAHAGARQGFFESNLVAALDYGLSYNRMGIRDEDSSKWRPLWVHTLDVGVTYLLNPETQVELIYSGGFSHGYHANRYRRVPITFRQDLRATEWVEETAPDQRLRNAFTVRAARALGDRWIVSADYRFYFDTWGVTGHTVTLGTSVDLAGGLSLELRARGSQQSGASFYDDIYTTTTEYRTRDRRLSPHLSGLAGAALTWNFGRYVDWDTLELRASVDGLVYSFDEFMVPELTSFGAAPWAPLGDVTGLVFHVQIGARP